MNARPKPSPRELQVLGLLRAGRSHDEIAAALKISPRTLRSHIGALFRKLGVTNRDQLMSLQLVETIMDKRYGPDEKTARLHAAAPDLLEALREWVDDPVPCAKQSTRPAGVAFCDCWACTRVRKNRADIAKATGGER